MIPEGVVKAATITSYDNVMVIIGVIVAFFFIVIIAKILPNRVQLIIAGINFKISKLYGCGDIIKINGESWYIDHMNTYRITFRKVVDWDTSDKEVKMNKKEDLSIDYITFLKMKIHRLGNCGS
jgi:hypothetical protein